MGMLKIYSDYKHCGRRSKVLNQMAPSCIVLCVSISSSMKEVFLLTDPYLMIINMITHTAGFNSPPCPFLTDSLSSLCIFSGISFSIHKTLLINIPITYGYCEKNLNCKLPPPSHLSSLSLCTHMQM